MVKKVLFIEGTTDDTNGDLRKGFRILLEKKFKNSNMPEIKLGNDKESTIRKFKNSNHEISLAMIDLDGKDNLEKNEILKLKNENLSELGVFDKKEYVFFMVQEMEAWFLSQPDVLEEYYNDKKIKVKIPKKNSELIPNPSDFLQKITKETKKGKYHKVKDAVGLLCKLDIEKLIIDFEDIKKLIDKLK